MLKHLAEEKFNETITAIHLLEALTETTMKMVPINLNYMSNTTDHTHHHYHHFYTHHQHYFQISSSPLLAINIYQTYCTDKLLSIQTKTK